VERTASGFSTLLMMVAVLVLVAQAVLESRRGRAREE
jgi:ABC-type sulfate transport system permease subunit